MKKILGSFMFVLALFGADVQVSTTHPFVKEPVFVQLHYKDREYKNIVWVKFAPKKSPLYEVVLLKKEHHNGEYNFSYLLFPLKSGQIEIAYTLKVKKAALEDIEQDILGTGYEQTNPVEGKVYKKDVKSTILHVKPVKEVDLYGDFNLRMHVHPKKVASFEPVYVDIALDGIGYPPKIANLLHIKGAKVLADKPKKDVVYTPKGAKISYSFKYAIMSDTNFTIPPIKLTEFDFHSYKTLSTQPVKILVVPPKNLVDTKNEPKKIVPFFEMFKALFGYLAIFVAGILSGVVLYLLLRRKEVEEIMLAKNHKELLALLVVRYPDCFEDIKQRLQRDENLLKIKKELLKRLKECRK